MLYTLLRIDNFHFQTKLLNLIGEICELGGVLNIKQNKLRYLMLFIEKTKL